MKGSNRGGNRRATPRVARLFAVCGARRWAARPGKSTGSSRGRGGAQRGRLADLHCLGCTRRRRLVRQLISGGGSAAQPQEDLESHRPGRRSLPALLAAEAREKPLKPALSGVKGAGSPAETELSREGD